MRRPKASVLIAAGLLALIALVLAVTRAGSQTASPSKVALKTFALEGQGVDFGGSGGESAEYLRGQTEFTEARTAPSGIVNPGAYSSAVSSLNGLSTVGTAWSDITRVPYDADDPAYRDYYSNSSGGSGLVTGRITGLAADPAGDIWAAGADGGVWRRNANASTWTDITGNVLSLSTGYLAYSGGSLWYATGEANTGGTSYVGAGVYVLTNPTSNTSWVRVGGNELESSTIHKLRFAGGKVWAATLFGVWYHSASTTSGSWTLAYAPNPASLTAPLQAYTIPGSWLNGQTFGTASSSLTNAPYKNIANDVAIDPNDSNHVIAALGWRSGDTYNGFYESFDGGFSWAKVNPTGSIPADDIGYVNFAMLGRRFEAVRDQRVARAAEQADGHREQLPGWDLRLAQRLRLRAPGRRSPSRRSWPTRARPSSRRSAARATAPGFSPGTTSSSSSTRQTPTTSTPASRRSTRR